MTSPYLNNSEPKTALYSSILQVVREQQGRRILFPSWLMQVSVDPTVDQGQMGTEEWEAVLV